MDKSLKKEALRFAKHFGMILDVPCSVVDLINQDYETDHGEKSLDVCELCPHKECHGYEQFSHGCREAYRWDGLYTFHCHQEMILICSSIASEKGDLVGGFVLGPVFLDNKEEVLALVSDKDYSNALLQVPEFSPPKIQAMSELLAAISGNLSDLSHGKAGRYFYRQDSLLNALYVERMKASETLIIIPIPLRWSENFERLSEAEIKKALRFC